MNIHSLPHMPVSILDWVEDNSGDGQEIDLKNRSDREDYRFLAMNGQCLAFATALAAIKGYSELSVVYEQTEYPDETDHLIHVLAKNGNAYYDIIGKYTLEQLNERYPNMIVKTISVNEYTSVIRDNNLSMQNFDIACEMVNEYSDQLPY